MSETESESGSESEEAGSGQAAIVVVDPDVESRNLAEDLEDDLDRHIIAIDSMEFDLEASEEILGATAFIIAWDLEIRSGVDLIEEIREHPQLCDTRILVSMAQPTREKVCWAIAMGADGVCMRPYDTEEVAARLASASEDVEKAA